MTGLPIRGFPPWVPHRDQEGPAPPGGPAARMIGAHQGEGPDMTIRRTFRYTLPEIRSSVGPNRL